MKRNSSFELKSHAVTVP